MLSRRDEHATEKERLMKLFIDTGSVAEVEEIAAWGVLSGATTNPSLLAKEEGDPGEAIVRICELVNGPVSGEVVSEDPGEMIAQGHALHALHEHVVVKVPFGAPGLQATRALSAEGIPVNMTLVFSPTQALMTAEAGATYVSCFMGRLDDISVDSAEVVAAICECLRRTGATAQVLAASIRSPEHVVTSAKLGCDVATIPGKVLRQMLAHPLTTQGIEKFSADWESRPEFGEWLKGLTSSRAVSA
jgi:transaldolase